jgi:CheY-like chemotaxis protein
MIASGSAALIVVVDDHEDIRWAHQTMLEGRGYRVETFASGTAALERLKDGAAHPPALVMTDLEMPGGDGLWLIRELAACSMVVPVVVLSGRVEARERAIEVGAAAFVRKPVGDYPALLSLIAALARGSTE